jgi:hypothetical protein
MSLQHHGLFSWIPDRRPWTTLSVYTSPWFLFTNSVHETMNHSISILQHHCLFSPIFCTRQWTPFSVSQHHCLFSPVSCTRPVSTICVYYTMVFSHPFHTWDHGPLYLSIHHHGLFPPILYMRPWTTLSGYATSWYLLTNFIHETMDHSICLYFDLINSGYASY